MPRMHSAGMIFKNVMFLEPYQVFKTALRDKWDKLFQTLLFNKVDMYNICQMCISVQHQCHILYKKKSYMSLFPAERELFITLYDCCIRTVFSFLLPCFTMMRCPLNIAKLCFLKGSTIIK